MTFKQYIKNKRINKSYSIRAMADILQLSHGYLADIEKGRRQAPNKVILDKIISALELNKPDKELLYDLAAKTRNDIPVDIKEYILSNKDSYNTIRKLIKESE